MRSKFIKRAVFFAAVVLGSVSSLWNGSANATPAITTLYTFCQQSNCTDGKGPHNQLLQDGAGNLYGSTSFGGTSNKGVVFELEKNGTAYDYHALYSLCSKGGVCADGSGPTGPLIIDTTGRLYGMTATGGPNDYGVIFQLTPDKTRTKWKYSVVYGFCKKMPCPDGAGPNGGLSYQGIQNGQPYDGSSPLYGATSGGGKRGDQFGDGVVFKLSRVSEKKWDEQVILCSDCGGAGPIGPFLPDASGNVYGSISRGAGHGSGAVVELSPKGEKKKYALTTLYNFCALADCADGGTPGSLSFGTNGKLYGIGGKGGINNQGVLFAITPNGTSSTEEVLHDFCALKNCSDGRFPLGSVVVASDGSVFGVTFFGGSKDEGSVYELHDGTFTTLYSFCSKSNCSDGANPDGGVILDSSGNLFGTASEATINEDSPGIAFELKP